MHAPAAKCLHMLLSATGFSHTAVSVHTQSNKPMTTNCDAHLGTLAGLYAVGDVEVHELGGQVHSCGQAVDYLHAVQAQGHGD